MRSISGKFCLFPERGGHSISNRLLEKVPRSKSASIAKAWTVFPLFWRNGLSAIKGPAALRPVSSLNSRFAQVSKSPDSTLPFGIDQAPSSLLRQYGPPGCASSNSIAGFRRKARMPALVSDRRDTWSPWPLGRVGHVVAIRRGKAYADTEVRQFPMRIVPAVKLCDRLGIALAGFRLYQYSFLEMGFEQTL